MKLKLCKDNLIDDDDMFCNESNTNCIPLPDKFLWSEEAKLRYQETYHTPEVKKNTISDIEKEFDSHSVQVQSLIDQITDVMLLAGNKYFLRLSFKPKRKHISKNNKKWYGKDCKSLLREVKKKKKKKKHLTD